MTNKILSIIKYTSLFFMGMILAINIISYFSLYVLKIDYPNIFGYTYFEVSTGSMRDAIKEQDIVIVKLDCEFKPGDIITYYSDNSLVTHRVQSIENDTVVTKGDANNVNDSPIKKDQVIGKVTKVIPQLGIVLKVITDKLTVLFALGVILIISYITSLKSKE